MNDTQPMAPTDDEIDAVVQACRERGLRELDVFRAVLAKWGTPPVPAGYALVPIEPTPEMLSAMWVPPNSSLADTYSSLSDAYNAMLAAAPQPVVRKPLTDEQVEALITTEHFREGYKLKASDRTCLAWYRLGLRDGERAHGITEGQHNAASN